MEPKVVVGLDFGTTFSGFAFAHRSAPDDIHLFFDWPKATRPYCKTETSLFYSRVPQSGNMKMSDWGFNASHSYINKLQENPSEHIGYLAKSFKLMLEDDGGRLVESNVPEGMNVMTLVTDYLRSISRFIADHLKEKYGKTFRKRDVVWCLTVPAIWSEASKEKMRACAESAGLVTGMHCPVDELEDASSHPLQIVLEPEAASFYCQQQVNNLQTGDKFVVADIGGGTIDVVVHERLNDNEGFVREVRASTGQFGGGTFVDRNFTDLLKSTIGCFQAFSKQDPVTVHRLLSTWARLKCIFDGTGSKLLEVPRKLSRAWKEHDEAVGVFRNEEFYDEIEISELQMRQVFDTEVEKVVELINKQVKSFEDYKSDIKYIFLVGGFAENPYMVKTIKDRFKFDVRDVVAPPNAGAAICKGAVAIGSGVVAVESRISKRWYGLQTMCPLNNYTEHGMCMAPIPGRVGRIVLGVYRMYDSFAVYVSKSQSVKENECVRHTFSPAFDFQTFMRLRLFSSSGDVRPLHISDSGCEEMASYLLDIREDLEMNLSRQLEVSMHFGRSSIEVFARRVNFGTNRNPERLYQVAFDLRKKRRRLD